VLIDVSLKDGLFFFVELVLWGLFVFDCKCMRFELV
jgi:hypothetical protein